MERAIADLKKANLLTIAQPKQLQSDGTWRGLAAVKAVNKLLFSAFGLHKWLMHERERASQRLAKKAKENGTSLTGWARNKLLLSGAKKAVGTRSVVRKTTTRVVDPTKLAHIRLDLLMALRAANPGWSAAELNEETDKLLAQHGI
ncbi:MULTISPECIES: hypothetical protein [Pseudomonas]|nr:MULTISPECIES: hypothetical protein [Pseudomonas]